MKIKKNNLGHWWIFCPGCGYHHVYDDRWTFNGNQELPTFTPSLLCRSERDGKPTVCHSFLIDGRLQFLADSTHHLSGQTVDLPNLPE